MLWFRSTEGFTTLAVYFKSAVSIPSLSFTLWSITTMPQTGRCPGLWNFLFLQGLTNVDSF